MDYKWHYDNLIESRKTRLIEDGMYYEKHHIIMKSMGGTNDIDNIVHLTAREHFLAHWLLWRIYRNRQTSRAFFSMCQYRKGDRKELKFSSIAYNEAKTSRSKTGISDVTRNKMSLAKRGKVYSSEARQNMSKAKVGSKPWNKGKVGITEKTRQLMSSSAQNKKRKHYEFFKNSYENFSEYFTPLQINILKFYIEGLTNFEISKKLSIKDYEIKNALRSIKTKVLNKNSTPYHT